MKKIIKIITSVAFICSLLLGSNNSKVTAGIGSTFYQNFTDRIMAERVAAIVGKAPTEIITATDVANETDIRVSNLGISSIEGIQTFVNLTRFDFGNNNVSDISPMAELTQLKTTYFSINKICDISPLANISSLELVEADQNCISNLASLAGKPILTTASLFIENQLIIDTQQSGTNIIVPNIVTDETGTLVTPSVISNSGVYNSTNLEWTGIPPGTQFVSYDFNKSPNSGYIFSGTVQVPLGAPVINVTASSVTYTAFTNVTITQFLEDIGATITSGNLSSNLLNIVDFSTPGEYIVTIYGIDVNRIPANPVEVTVIIVDPPVEPPILPEPEVPTLPATGVSNYIELFGLVLTGLIATKKLK